jgi:hypothetical protein
MHSDQVIDKPLAEGVGPMAKVCPFDEAYFMRGKQTGVSLYENYRWLPELTVPMVEAMIRHLGISPKETVFDFGCARGYTVKAFRQLGYDAFGCDVSPWAIQNCDPRVERYVFCGRHPGLTHDWIIAKDVLEHVPDIADTINNLRGYARRGLFVVVPLSIHNGSCYVVPDYELDVTHINRWTLPMWAAMFMQQGWSVEARYFVDGVKMNYVQYPRGNGFITCRRIPQ